MSFVLTCPNCGRREVTDFRFGGEVVARPGGQRAPSRRELNSYNYFRANVAAVQREWWYHRSGCRSWFLAERDTRTNHVLWTALPEQAGAVPGQPQSGGAVAATADAAAGQAGLH